MPRPIIRAPIDGKCRVCGSSEFGTRNRCKPCHAKAKREKWARDADFRKAAAARKRQWRRANPTKARSEDLRSNYGIDLEHFERLLQAQENRCAICREEAPNCLDHCHATRKVRGVLCRKCNAGLGQFRDDPTLLEAAIRYLATHRNH